MPFKSKSQVKACFAKRDRGQAKGWNCEEWAESTPNIKKLPEKVGSSHNKATDEDKRAAVVVQLEKQAASIPALLGIRAAAMMLGVK